MSFKNGAEYEAYLSHSSQIIDAFKPFEFSRKMSPRGLSLEDSEMFECFLEHLRTEYPKLYKLWNSFKETVQKVEKYREAIEDYFWCCGNNQ